MVGYVLVIDGELELVMVYYRIIGIVFLVDFSSCIFYWYIKYFWCYSEIES